MRTDMIFTGPGPGRVLKGQYRIDAELGSGAMGIVLRGTVLALDKPVAIKIMRPDAFNTRDAQERFQREARLASRVNSPYIAQVQDFGIEDGMPFLVMELVEGLDLAQIMERDGPMPPSRAVAVMRQLAAALGEAHRQGVIHRDIKPSNLKLPGYRVGVGGPDAPVCLKVMDFGIAKQMGGSEQGKLTATGAVIGTPMYMAPEQAGSGAKLDGRADLYAAGIVLYEMLTGALPFDGPSLAGVLVSHLVKPPPPLPRQVPEPLRQVVARLLKKSPDERYASAEELDAALAACEEAARGQGALPKGLVLSGASGPDATPGGGGLRRAALFGGGAGVLLASVAIVAIVKLRDPAAGRPVGDAGAKLAQAGKPGEGAAPAEAGGKPAEAGAKGTEAGTKGPRAPEAGSKPTQAGSKPAEAGTKGPRAPEAGSKPAEAGSKPGVEPAEPHREVRVSHPEALAKLKEAEAHYQEGRFDEAIASARQSLGYQRATAPWRVIANSYCRKGDLGGVNSALPHVASSHRRGIIDLCRKNNVDLE